MEEIIKSIMHNYIKNVENTCNILLEGINYSEYYDKNLIKNICEKAIDDGIMFKQYEQYYFSISKSETFEPNFPKEFDTLVVEHHGLKWSIPRNKIIDRFIRKSKRVYNQIDKNQDKYLLLFMFEGREIYSIPFDDCEKMMNLSHDIIYWMFSKNSYFSDNYQLLELENSFVINSDDNYKFI